MTCKAHQRGNCGQDRPGPDKRPDPPILADGDPKLAAGIAKVPFGMISPAALEAEARVMALGAAKYGAFNFLDNRMKATTYVHAMLRHLLQYASGQDRDAESRQPHLAHLRACAGILIDQHASGMLIDDRPSWATLSDLKLEKPEDGSK